MVTLLLCIMSFSVNANKASILPPPQKISEHVYGWIGPLPGPSKENQGFRMNLIFIVGKNAVAVVDTGYTEAMAHEMLAHIKKITNVPIKFAINSNSQPHRFMGNPVFRAAGITIIAHKDSVTRMNSMGGNFAGTIERILELSNNSVTIPKAPDRVINADTKLDLGDLVISLKNQGPAHTPAQLVVEVAKDKVVYTGDILYVERLLAVLPDSNIKSWLSAYEKLKEYGDVTFIPGHGQPGKLKTFEFSTQQYLTLLFNHMNKMVEEGVDLQEAIEKLDQSRFSKLTNYEELSGRNANLTYVEREAASFE